MKATLSRLLGSFWLAPLAGGALLWASFAPLDIGWLSIPGWALLLASMRVRRGAAAGRQGLVAGLVLFVPGFSWIAPLVGGGWLFTAFYAACHEALFGWLLGRLWLRRERAGWIVAAGLLHVGVDMVRTVTLTGFPWLVTGYAGWEMPVLLGGAGLIGVHGATLAIVWLGAGLAGFLVRTLEGREDRLVTLVPAGAAWGVLAAWTLFAVPVQSDRPGPRVALLQGAVPQKLKEQLLAEQGGQRSLRELYDAHLERWWESHIRLLQQVRDAEEPVDVVIWPETMVPPYPDPAHRDPARSARLWKRLAHLSGDGQTLAGVIRRDDLGRSWNSVVLVDRDGNVRGAQDKQHRTPGGEYIPLLESVPFRDAIERALIDKAGFLPDLQAGEGPEVLTIDWDGGEARVGVLICIEVLFPELGREMVLQGADFLVIASNYGWFEGTAQMDQALAMSVFRASELGVSVVCASNNGHSVILGPDGARHEAVVAPDGRRTDVPGVAMGAVPLGGRATPFRLWGERPAWLLGLAGLLWGLAGLRTGRGDAARPAAE